MAYADTVPSFRHCPRCRERAYEVFKTHAYCAACFYEQLYSDSLCVIPHWALQALENEKKKNREQGPRAVPSLDLAQDGMSKHAPDHREFGISIINPITESEVQDPALAPTNNNEEKGG